MNSGNSNDATDPHRYLTVLVAALVVQKSQPSTYVVVVMLFVVALTVNVTARARRARKAQRRT